MDIANRIYTQARKEGMPDLLAKFIVAQSARETAQWTSAIFNDCSNCFGYKWVGQVEAVGPCPGHSDYADYNYIEESVTEITDWIKRRQRNGVFPADLNQIKTSDQYAGLLKQAGYYEDTYTNYSAGLNYWMEKLRLNSLTIKTGGFILVAALFFLFAKKFFNS